MNTANLRLKFVPFIKKESKDSMYRLEIIPQVSCLENLKEIKLQDSKEKIEYIVPIVYKIVIRKGSKILSEDQKLTQNVVSYHSCVDLPISSELDLGRGDLARHLSENLIYDQTDSSECNLFVKEIRNIFADYRKEMYDNFGNDKTEFIESAAQLVGLTYNEDSSISQTRCTVKKETITNEDSLRAIKYYKTTPWPEVKKLTMTPICLLAAEDPIFYKSGLAIFTSPPPIDIFPFPRENFENNSNTLACVKFKGDYKDITESSEIRKVKVSSRQAQLASTITKCPQYRILTEIKKAEFRNTLIAEMVPLQIQLNEIVASCRANDIKYGIGDGKGLVRMRKCNRVIYSFVFDD